MEWFLIIIALVVIGLLVYPSLKNKDSAKNGMAGTSRWLEKIKTPSSPAPIPNQEDETARRLKEIERKLNDMNAAIERLRNDARQNNMSVDKRFNGIADTVIQMQNELNMLKYRPIQSPPRHRNAKTTFPRPATTVGARYMHRVSTAT